MKKITYLLIALPLINLVSLAQQVKENNQELSKNAQRGMLDNSVIDKNGNLVFTYKMKTDKKSEVVNYEDYVFDSDLNFKGIEPDKKQKEQRENQTITSLSAYVGGGNSFNVLSMKLSLQREEWERNWDYGQQKYKWGKRLSKEVVKPKNAEGKYKGYAAYPNDEDGSVFIIASSDTDDKETRTQYLGLYVNTSLELKETPFPVKGNYTLVYCGRLASKHIFAILAPNKGEINTSAYVYLEFSENGALIYNTPFIAPASAIAIMDDQEKDGSLFLIAGSVKKAAAYNTAFESYAPIYNPGYTTSTNAQMDRYEKKIYNQEFENLHLLKFEKGNLIFAGTTPIDQFKSKVKTPPSQKKSTPYVGKKLVVQGFMAAPNGDFLVSGQLEDKKIINGGNTIQHYYYDIVCLHFDPKGNLKAQYAVEKINDDKKSEMFQSGQHFFVGEDAKTIYWEILEVKGAKGYDSFIDAYNGNPTSIANYFPRIAKIDLQNTSLSDFNILGNKGKFLLYKYQSYLYNEHTKTRYYVGHDEDYKKIWVGKAVLQ